MKPAAFVLLLVSAVAVAAGEDRDPGAVVPQTDIRKEAVSFYKYDPRARVPSPLPPFLAREAPPPPGQSLVNSAPSDLRKPHVLNRLHAAVLREQADARTALVASRLGIGVSSVRVGGPLVAGVATAFYIPVAVGIGFSW
jgi:hypothetical protein